jgi:hypothetical protein
LRADVFLYRVSTSSGTFHPRFFATWLVGERRLETKITPAKVVADVSPQAGAQVLQSVAW